MSVYACVIVVYFIRESIILVSSYRLAPEHPFPAAFDDCVAATRHLMEHASEYNVNPNRVVIAGDFNNQLFLFRFHRQNLFNIRAYIGYPQRYILYHSIGKFLAVV